MPSPSKFLLKYFPFHCSFFFPSFFPLPRYFLIGIFLLLFCHSHHLLPSSWATWIPHSLLLFAFFPFAFPSLLPFPPSLALPSPLHFSPSCLLYALPHSFLEFDLFIWFI